MLHLSLFIYGFAKADPFLIPPLKHSRQLRLARKKGEEYIFLRPSGAERA